MKRWAARLMRSAADRLDPGGSPQRTSWSFTQHKDFGTVFNQDGYGCPVYTCYDQQMATLAYSQPEIQDCDIQWVTIGSRTPDGVHVLGSAEVIKGSTTRRLNGYDEIRVPGASRIAKVPRWRIKLVCEMDSFVTLPGGTYPEAVEGMFKRDGIRG